MTLIVTTISNLGLLQISDSKLTFDDGDLAGHGPKTFELGFCPGALALAGSYNIGSAPMDQWMTNAIGDFSRKSDATLEGFATYLRDRLCEDVDPGVTALMVHIAGYSSTASGSHPEMWFVRNFGGIDETTGNYVDRTDTFTASEDFWTRDYPNDRTSRLIGSDPYLRWYFNGLPQGRISFNLFNSMFWQFLRTVWSHPDWTFRAPNDLSGLADLTKHELAIIGTLFEISGLHYVGGDVQVKLVQPPADAVSL